MKYADGVSDGEGSDVDDDPESDSESESHADYYGGDADGDNDADADVDADVDNDDDVDDGEADGSRRQRGVRNTQGPASTVAPTEMMQPASNELLALRLAILCNQAACYLKLGDGAAALDAADRASSLSSPKDSLGGIKAAYRKGCALEAVGEWVEARRAFKSVLEVDPGNVQCSQVIRPDKFASA